MQASLSFIFIVAVKTLYIMEVYNMKKETMIGLKKAGVQIGLHGILIPALATGVGFLVQKWLMKSEQKKALLTLLHLKRLLLSLC